MAEMINREAPLSGLSSLMAMKGRQGDTELIHMTKPEIAGLASLGKLTINPDTGLPEAFSFKQFLPALAGIAATAATGGLAAPLFAGSSFILPALAAGGTSAIVNKGDIGAIAFDALLAGAGGALSGAATGASSAGEIAKGGEALAASGKGAMSAGQLAGGAAQGAGAGIGAGASGVAAASAPMTTQALQNVAAKELASYGTKGITASSGMLEAGAKEAARTSPAAKAIDFISAGKINPTEAIPNLGGITPVDVAGAAAGSAPSVGLAALGMPTTGGGMLESMKVDTPEIAARKAAESSYGTRAADEVRQPAKADGLTTQEVLSSALGRSDPLTYLSGSRPSNVSSPSNLYGGPTGVVAMPARGAGPVGGYVPAASGGNLQDLYEGMGGDIQTFKGLVEGGEIGSDGMSDDVEFEVIDGGEEGPDNALLSKDEYVIDAHSVAALGNGSTDAGADRLDKFVANLRNKAYNKGKQPKQLNGLKELATLMS